MSRPAYVVLWTLGCFVGSTLILFLESGDLGLSALFGLGFALLAFVMFATDPTHRGPGGR